MKKLQSTIATLAVAMLMIIGLTACGSKADKIAESFVEQANKELPSAQGGVTAEKARLDGKSIVFEIKFDANTSVDMDMFKEQQEAMKTAAIQMLKARATKEENSNFKVLAEGGYSIKYVYTNGTDSFDLVLTPEDLLDATK